jgi:hypothetical protein
LFFFVRLLDYMVADAVHSLVDRSLSYLVMRLQGAQRQQQLARKKSIREAASREASVAASASTTPLQASRPIFSIEIYLGCRNRPCSNVMPNLQMLV